MRFFVLWWTWVGFAAVAVEPTAHGDSTTGGAHAALLNHRIARACLISAALFAISAIVPEPFRYALWLLAGWLVVCAVLTTSARDQLVNREA